MLDFNLKKRVPSLDVGLDATKQMIIGIRPCDVHGILAFDPTFESEFKDPYFRAFRENTLLVGLACNKPDMNCFCKSLSSGPFNNTGMDIIMVDLDQDYVCFIMTKSGQEAVAVANELFKSPTNEQLEEVEKLKESAEQVPTRDVITNGKPEKMGKIFEDDYWAKTAQRCLGCGICTYLCPTCYCFDITDENWGKKGKRMRTWDSCMYPEYTVHASDYNPRPARMNRLRNRFYHKFKYYLDLHNIFGCTGCGRCIRHCPVNIDIIDVINGVGEIKISEGGE
jgi:ferredoxin